MRPITQITQMAALFVVGLLLAVPATDATAQTAPVPPAWVSTVGLPLDVMAHIEKGDQLVGEQKYGAARKEYEAAAKVLEAQGLFPVVPRRRIAESYYFEGNYPRAVAALDHIAASASQNGDLVTQVWALADAAWVLGEDYKRRPRGGAKMELEARLERLATLVAAPFLPEEVRQEVTAKRLEGCCYALGKKADPRFTLDRPQNR